jgi:hypothetical protein
VELLLLLRYLLFGKLKNTYDVLFFFIFIYIVSGIILLSLVLRTNFIPHQWFVFAIPYTIFSLVYFLTNLPQKKIARVLLIGLVLINGFYSIGLSLKIQEQGSGGIHLTTYGVKKEILNFIYSRSQNPKIDFHNVDSFGNEGWNYLIKYYPKDPTKKVKHFVVFEQNYWFRKIDPKQLEKYNDYKKHIIHNQIVFVKDL